MFRRLFNWKPKVPLKADQERKPNRFAIAFVAFANERLPDPDRVAELLVSKHLGIEPPVTARYDPERESPLLTVATPAFEGAAVFIPSPFPWSDLEGPCETAWWWPEATQVMKSHSAHAIVTLVPGTENILFNSLMVGKLAASIAEAGDAVGIYWGSGTLVHPVSSFSEQIAKASLQDLPLDLWVDFRIQRVSPTQTQIITTGMDTFNKPELEIGPVEVLPGELLEFAIGVADYVLTGGADIREGQTIGRNADEKYRITFSKSIWERPGIVMHLQL